MAKAASLLSDRTCPVVSAELYLILIQLASRALAFESCTYVLPCSSSCRPLLLLAREALVDASWPRRLPFLNKWASSLASTTRKEHSRAEARLSDPAPSKDRTTLTKVPRRSGLVHYGGQAACGCYGHRCLKSLTGFPPWKCLASRYWVGDLRLPMLRTRSRVEMKHLGGLEGKDTSGQFHFFVPSADA
ncbi:uncharacterized protein B0T15DRAFT_243238 [Chaetomium strumarium]|uniref:Uncharacterized protein n=1 Tax=Chaetomium strumarium TaxID=1170767 RepID=A0AAJ0M0L7_9PEZI|nr:hypothetical protein B0T15DRAFT_243238 [Chaetomium strumarium]